MEMNHFTDLYMVWIIPEVQQFSRPLCKCCTAFAMAQGAGYMRFEAVDEQTVWISDNASLQHSQLQQHSLFNCQAFVMPQAGC